MDFKPNLKRDVRWQSGWKDLAEAWVKVKVPGVTTVISEMIPDPEIEKWKQDVGEEVAQRITEAAQHRGTAMHMFIENWLIEMKKTGDPSAALRHTQTATPPVLETEEKVPEKKIHEGRNLFYKFLESDYAKNFTKLLGTETSIYSPKLFYRGKIDWLYEQNLYGLSLSDFKTMSKPIIPGSRKEEGYKHQLGAYALALDQMLQEKNPGTSQRINYASIIGIHTKSNMVQNIFLQGPELEEYKSKFETIAREYHIKHGQKFLLGE